jgi:hypothetical protein
MFFCDGRLPSDSFPPRSFGSRGDTNAAREESERIGRCTPLLSRVGWHPSDIRLNDTSMSTPEAYDSTEQQGSTIPPDEDSVEIDVADVEYEQTYAPGTTPATSLSRRALELTDIEVSFKRARCSSARCSSSIRKPSRPPTPPRFSSKRAVRTAASLSGKS